MRSSRPGEPRDCRCAGWNALSEDAIGVGSGCVDPLIDAGWSNDQTALPTTNSRHPIHQEYFESERMDEYWREFHTDEGESYGHVLGFKGVERSVIILCVDGFRDLDRAAERHSVGLSRARTLLVVADDSTQLREATGSSWLQPCPRRTRGALRQLMAAGSATPGRTADSLCLL